MRGCGLELDAPGHHRTACSAALGGERTQHHHEVVHYLQGQLWLSGWQDFHARTRMSTFHSTPVHRSGGRSISTATSTCLDSLVVLSGTEPSLTLFERTPTPSWGIYMLRSVSRAD